MSLLNPRNAAGDLASRWWLCFSSKLLRSFWLFKTRVTFHSTRSCKVLTSHHAAGQLHASHSICYNRPTLVRNWMISVDFQDLIVDKGPVRSRSGIRVSCAVAPACWTRRWAPGQTWRTSEPGSLRLLCSPTAASSGSQSGRAPWPPPAPGSLESNIWSSESVVDLQRWLQR